MLVLRFWFVRLAAALMQTRDALELHVWIGRSCNRPAVFRLATSTRPVPSYTGAGRWSW